MTHRILNNIMGLIKDQTDHLSLIEVGNEFVPGIRSMETSLLANFYQLINCCNILCVTEYVTMYLYFISGYYNTEYAWSNYTYLSSCTYMQIRRVDLSYVSGLPTFHMLPTPL